MPENDVRLQETSVSASVQVCRGCGWAQATSDGYCLDCVSLDEIDYFCPQCGHAWCCEDTHGP